MATQPTRYQARATVLQSPDHGPQLCLGGVATSLPPQCGGPPVANWDWGAVPGEQSGSGTTWGEYVVVGTYDGYSFALTQPATAAPPPAQAFSGLTTPCPEPHNGHLPADPARAAETHLAAATALARRQPDLGGLWLDQPDTPRPDGSVRRGSLVLNVAFTGSLEQHERELRAEWGGALCVSLATRSLSALRATQSDLWGAAPRLGLQLLAAGIDEPRNAVAATVVLATPKDQAAVDARFGTGVVRLQSALQMVA